MTRGLSKTQIDKLGDRLKRGNISETDLRLLDQYRRAFSEAYEVVVGKIQNELKLEPTGRPAKSTTSIADKLRRESIRLTQIQDIAGCRLIVQNINEQELVIDSLKAIFERFSIIDRREQPSHGYRAVHVVVQIFDKLIEVQVRTAPQQLWAELSEKFSDVIDPAIKYGGGKAVFKKILAYCSLAVAILELLEKGLAYKANSISAQEASAAEETQMLTSFQERVDSAREKIFKSFPLLLEAVESIPSVDYKEFEEGVDKVLRQHNIDPEVIERFSSSQNIVEALEALPEE